jgi:hypothetical protein
MNRTQGAAGSQESQNAGLQNQGTASAVFEAYAKCELRDLQGSLRPGSDGLPLGRREGRVAVRRNIGDIDRHWVLLKSNVSLHDFDTRCRRSPCAKAIAERSIDLSQSDAVEFAARYAL